MRRFWAVLGGVVMVAAACGGGGRHSSSPTTGTLPPPATSSTTTLVPTSTTTVPDASVVPAVITVAYVDAVFVKLDAVLGDAVRNFVARGGITTSGIRDLRAIYSASSLAAELSVSRSTLHAALHDIRRPPGNERTIVVKLIKASTSCIFVQTRTDYSAVDLTTVPIRYRSYYILTRKSSHGADTQLNPTPWMISKVEIRFGAQAPSDRC